MRRTVANLMAAVLVALAALPLTASAVAAGCAEENVVLYEDSNSSGDAIQRCLNVPNLDDVPHVQADLCKAFRIRLKDSWNDCVSSIRVTLQAHRCVAFYRDANYVGRLLTVAGPRAATLYNLVPGVEDEISSLRFYSKVNGLC